MFESYSKTPYLVSPKLKESVNISLLLGVPLLIFAESGMGKTRFAYDLACKLKLGKPLIYQCHSNSKASDIFYSYDYLRAYKQKENFCAIDYIEYEALGKAIIRSHDSQDSAFLLPDQKCKKFNWLDESPSASVVLIDNIHLTSREFANDLLNEMEESYFKIPELGNVCLHSKIRPIVIFTSLPNVDFPSAFMRRCIVCEIGLQDFNLQDILTEQQKYVLGDKEAFFSIARNFLQFLHRENVFISMDKVILWLVNSYHNSTTEIVSKLQNHLHQLGEESELNQIWQRWEKQEYGRG